MIHPGNHQWNNRSLILQYASIDAVRRGGYPDADGKRVFVKGAKVDDAGEGTEAPAVSVDVEGTYQTAEPEETSQKPTQPPDDIPRNEGSTIARRRGPTGGRVKQDRPRPKPGAALAAAKRATAGIVPGQGTKVKFN